MELNESGKRKIDTSKFNGDEKSKIEVTEGLKYRTTDPRIDMLIKDVEEMKNYYNKAYVDAQKEAAIANIKVRLERALVEFGKAGNIELDNLKKVYIAMLDAHNMFKLSFNTLSKVYSQNLQDLQSRIKYQDKIIQDLTVKLNEKKGWFK